MNDKLVQNLILSDRTLIKRKDLEINGENPKDSNQR